MILKKVRKLIHQNHLQVVRILKRQMIPSQSKILHQKIKAAVLQNKRKRRISHQLSQVLLPVLHQALQIRSQVKLTSSTCGECRSRQTA